MSGVSRLVNQLTKPLPNRWRPFSAFIGGLAILAVLAVFGRFNGDAWRFFAAFTAFGAVFGVVWTLVRSRRRPSPTTQTRT